MHADIVILPGDGIGPEVTAAAVTVLTHLARLGGHTFTLQEHLLGGCAIDATGEPLPEVTLAACREADAILLGAVGGPKWDDPRARTRPEAGLLGLRKELELYANLRPVRPHPDLAQAAPLKPEKLAGVDLLVMRELTGGIYYGQPRGRYDDGIRAVDTMVYTKPEVARIAHLAFQLARERRGLVTSIDKANVLECSRLWRETVVEVAEAYPDVRLEHLLVDAATMHLLTRPATFDVLLTGNLFGDILSDEASVLSGSLGNLPSASLGAHNNRHGRPQGLYEPIHGSAPDIAGQGIANPVGTVLSLAMLLRHSLGLAAEAAAVEAAVEQALAGGARTRDLARPGEAAVSTEELTGRIVTALTPDPSPTAWERGNEIAS